MYPNPLEKASILPIKWLSQDLLVQTNHSLLKQPILLSNQYNRKSLSSKSPLPMQKAPHSKDSTAYKALLHLLQTYHGVVFSSLWKSQLLLFLDNKLNFNKPPRHYDSTGGLFFSPIFVVCVLVGILNSPRWPLIHWTFLATFPRRDVKWVKMGGKREAKRDGHTEKFSALFFGRELCRYESMQYIYIFTVSILIWLNSSHMTRWHLSVWKSLNHQFSGFTLFSKRVYSFLTCLKIIFTSHCFHPWDCSNPSQKAM